MSGMAETLTDSGPKSLQELQEITKAHPLTLGEYGIHQIVFIPTNHML